MIKTIETLFCWLSISFLISNPGCRNDNGHKDVEKSTIEIKSPGGQIRYTFRITNGYPAYSVSYKDKLLVQDSRLSLEFKETGEFGRDLILRKPRYRKIDETYNLIVGKTKTARNFCNELTVPLVEKNAPFRRINLVIRAFNDGIAFRYEFPGQEQWKSFLMTEENSTFKLSGDPLVLALFRPHFQTSHEGLYNHLRFHEIKQDTLIDLPVLIDFQGIYMAITEAALVDYAGMYLVKKDSLLVSELSPLPGQEDMSSSGKTMISLPGQDEKNSTGLEGKSLQSPDGKNSEYRETIRVKATLPHKSPWRVMLISDRMSDLFESNILTSLNEPCKIVDTSWIKPGKATWPWWNGTVVGDPAVRPGNNFETNKYYIDFCARHNLEYHSVVEYAGHEWYVNNGTGYQPGTEFDVTHPVDGLDMQKVCDYADSKGVGIRVWVHWAALYPKLDEAFALYERWGVKGLMVDFMDRDDQQMVNIQNEILQKAAQHHLHIQFHGAYKPTGYHRTYPNEFTREGTLNYEVNKWDKTITPAHDLDIVFTRLLAGATDYHLGGFRAVPEDRFEIRYEKPLMMGTRCHMLAMYVVLESYLSLVCDYPEAYENQPGFEFIEQVPTTWDETRVLGAGIQEYIIMARSKNSDWYVGAITDDPRDISVSFDFLEDGDFSLELYTDVNGNPNAVKKEIVDISYSSKRDIHMASGGGMAMYIRKIIK